MPGLGFDPNGYVNKEYLANQETRNLTLSPYKNAKAVQLTDNNGNVVGGFNLPLYDYVALNSSGSTTDIYSFKTGGSGGTLVATLTINYVDSTKAVITDVTKT